MADIPIPPWRDPPLIGLPASFTLSWVRWFQQLSVQSGGTLTPAQVEAMIVAALTPVLADIAALQADVAALEGGMTVFGLLAVAELDGTVV